MNEAYEKALKGGYKDTCPSDIGVGLEHLWYVRDPLFWQALGKSLGWEEKIKNHDPVWKVIYNIEEITVIPRWANVMLEFTFHLTNGKDPELFFKELLK